MAKKYKVNGIEFTDGEYRKIMRALELRVEACKDNEEHQMAASWHRVGKKVLQAFIPFEVEKPVKVTAKGKFYE